MLWDEQGRARKVRWESEVELHLIASTGAVAARLQASNLQKSVMLWGKQEAYTCRRDQQVEGWKQSRTESGCFECSV